jgi:predicted Fe-Mo cluster-binding NifX family protein
MDPVHTLYMRLRTIESKVAQCDIDAIVAPDEVKAAYSVIKAHHISTITAIKTEIATAISAAINTPK